MLIRRLNENEKSGFAEAVDAVAKTSQNRIVYRYVPKNGIELQTLDELHTKEIVDSASSVIDAFKRLIVKRFSAEIPELLSEA